MPTASASSRGSGSRATRIRARPSSTARASRKTRRTPNLRQVHLIHAELFDELRARGFAVSPGLMGENVTTSGIDLLALPTGTRLHLGGEAVVEVTGLRNPCRQLDSLQPGLMAATLDRDGDGNLIRKAGIMAIVVSGGDRARGRPDPGRACRRTAASCSLVPVAEAGPAGSDCNLPS